MSVFFLECLFVVWVFLSVVFAAFGERATYSPRTGREQKAIKAEKDNGNLQFHFCVSTKNINQEGDGCSFFSWWYCNPQCRLSVSLADIYQVRFMIICERIYVIYREDFCGCLLHTSHLLLLQESIRLVVILNGASIQALNTSTCYI